MPKVIDVLTPFAKADSNRMETLLVQMHGFLYNRTAAYAINMLKEYNKWIKIFPKLNMFCDMSPYQLYRATAYYDVMDIFFTICSEEMAEDIDTFANIIINAIDELDKMDIRQGLITPLTAYALTQIAIENCCKKIIVTKSTEFTTYDEQYLATLFNNNIKKIELVSGEFYEIWKDNVQNITTTFINDLSVTEPIAQFSKDNNLPNYIDRQLFMLRLHNRIIDLDPVTKRTKYNCTEQFEELEKVKVHVGVITPDPYPVQDTKVPILRSKK